MSGGEERSYVSLDLTERQLIWLRDGMDAVLDGLRDQVLAEPAGESFHQASKQLADAERFANHLQELDEDGA